MSYVLEYEYLPEKICTKNAKNCVLFLASAIYIYIYLSGKINVRPTRFRAFRLCSNVTLGPLGCFGCFSAQNDWF